MARLTVTQRGFVSPDIASTSGASALAVTALWPQAAPDATFASAISAANAAGGGSLWVTPGTYAFTGPWPSITSNVKVYLSPGAVLDFSSATGLQPAITFTGSDVATIALTNDVTAGQQHVRVTPGSEPADGTRIRLASTDQWASTATTGPPPLQVSGAGNYKGEIKTVVRPTGILSVQATNGDTKIVVNNAGDDARIGANWPANASLRIGVEDLPYAGVPAVSSSTVTFTLAGTVGTTHAINTAVALTPGYVGLKSVTDDAYTVANAASITTLTMLTQVGITGEGTIIGPGFNTSSQAVNFDRCINILSSPTLVYKNWDQAAIYLSDTVESTFMAPSIFGGKSNSNEFYGISAQWATRDITILGGWVQECRHAFTTSGSTSRKGVARRIKIKGMHTLRTSSHSFDTHPSGEDITFEDCTSEHAAACGFSMRAPNVKILGCHVKYAGDHAVRLRNESLQPTRFMVDNLTVQSPRLVGLTYRPDGTATTLGSTILVGDAPPFNVTVGSTSSWDTSDNYIYIGTEWFAATVTNSTTFSVTARAQKGSTAAGHSIGATVQSPLSGSGALVDYVDVDNIVVQDAGWGGNSTPSVQFISQDTFALTNIRVGSVLIKDQEAGSTSSGGLLFTNVTDSSVERVSVKNHPATSVGVVLNNCTNVKVSHASVGFASRSTGTALRLIGSSECEIAYPVCTNAGTGILVDSASSGNRLRGVEALYEDATVPVNDSGNSVLDGGANKASRARNYGFITFNFEPDNVQNNDTLSATGTLNLIRLTIPRQQPITSIVTYLGAGGVGLTTNQCFAALYSALGGLQAVTADQSVLWLTAGKQAMALVGGPITPPAGDYWVALWYNGGTSPGFDRAINQAVIQAGSSGSMYALANTGVTTTAPNTLSGVTGTGANKAFWAALL